MAGNRNSGRRPMPTALKMLRGNPGKRGINHHEPKPPDGPVTVPRGMSRGARAVWKELAPIAVAMRTLTAGDQAVFRRLCELEATARYASSQKDRKRPGERLEDMDGRIRAWVKIEHATAQALRPYYEKFGLEPVGRARIRLPKDPVREVDRWEGLLTG